MPRVRDGVTKRGSTWSYVIRVRDPATGLSRPRWVGGFPTEEAAKAARDEARVRARRGEYVDRSTMTVGEYLREWVEAHAATVKPKTLFGYRKDIDLYIVPRIGRERLQALRPATVSKFYRDLAEGGGRDGRPLSASTVSHVHRTLRKALDDAVQVEGLLASNPAARAKRPRARRPEPGKVWTAAQLRAFLEHARSHRLFAFFHLAAHTGARRGELLHLRWSAVDLAAAEVTFGGTTSVIGGQRIEGSTKNDASRVVSLDAGTVQVLRDHHRRQAAERLAAGPDWDGRDDLVFTNPYGEPLYPDTATYLMSKLIDSYNHPAVPGKRGRPRRELPPPAEPLPHARLHDLRHMHATTLLLAGVPVHVVAARLGHSDPAVTLRVYAHVLREQAAGVADVFAQALDPAVSKGVSK